MTLKDLPPNATVNFTFYGVARDFASYRSPQATIFDGVALWCENEGKVSTYLSVPSLTVVKVSLLGRVELGHCFLPVASLCPGYQHIYLQGKDRATIFSLFVCVKTKEGIDDAERKRLKARGGQPGAIVPKLAPRGYFWHQRGPDLAPGSGSSLIN
eukprot:m.291967 g.291967  ORF g.291967 m.291967 type:complete len:156 (+) comp40729_c2_seq32:2410-2877(+)